MEIRKQQISPQYFNFFLSALHHTKNLRIRSKGMTEVKLALLDVSSLFVTRKIHTQNFSIFRDLLPKIAPANAPQNPGSHMFLAMRA